MTAWHITYAAIFALAMLGVANVFCTAPDRMQKFVVLPCLLVGFALLYAYHCAGAVGYEPHWEIEELGFNFIVWATLIHIFRIHFNEHLSCKNLSASSPRSPA